MTPAYPAARAVAPAVVAHLENHRAAARESGFTVLGPLPDAATVEALIDCAFWASLQREEGHEPRISLAWVSPTDAGHAMRFARPLPLESRVLSRLAPAVERPGIHLGAWPDAEGTLRVWGTARAVPTLALVIEVVEPGLLVLKYRRGDEFDKYGTIAVLEGDRAQVVDELGAQLPDCPTLLSSLLGFETAATAVGSNVLIQLAISMRAHRRGGSLLVVPADTTEWLESVVQPITYAVTPYDEIAALLAADGEAMVDPAWRDALRRTVDAVAGLTAVDGATVINSRHELLAFGAKLSRRRGRERVERVVVSAPVVGIEPRPADPSVLGGTRHLSAAQFVSDQHDALAMVASQDGRFTVLAWSPCDDAVHAHRIETLLM